MCTIRQERRDKSTCDVKVRESKIMHCKSTHLEIPLQSLKPDNKSPERFEPLTGYFVQQLMTPSISYMRCILIYFLSYLHVH